jgi:hypothetical protein
MISRYNYPKIVPKILPVIIPADILLNASLYFVILNKSHAKNRRRYQAVK